MTFLEGLLSFISPCLLPLVPVYLIYMAGSGGERPVSRARTLVNAFGFVLGFSTVFITLGVAAGSLGAALAAHRRAVDIVCAVIVALMGLSFLGILRLPTFGFGGAAQTLSRKIAGPFSAFLFGMVFSVCLTPCVGAFLGAALATAASAGGSWKGAVLLAEYSAGLAIPFLLSALLIDRLRGLFGKLKAQARMVSIVSGVLLIGFALWLGAGKPMGRSGMDEGASANLKTDKEKTMEVILTDANFEAEVLKSDKPVIVDFWATWCGPCRMLAPELEALAAEKGDAIKVGKVNVDENPGLCAKYGILSIPAVFVFKNGKITAQSVGFVRQADLAALLEK